MTITSGNFAKALWPGVKKWYAAAYGEHPLEWSQIFDQDSSGKAYEEDVQVSGLGLAPVKPQGSATSYDTMSQGFVQRYTHLTYSLGFIVTEEAKEDDQYDVVAKRGSKRLGFSMRQTQEVVAANVLNRAFNSAYAYGDGVELLSAAHPNTAGGTFANELSVAADLSEASIEQACIDIMRFTDDRGLRIRVMPRCLIVPPELAFDAERILKSTLQNDTANNAINAVRSMGLFPDGVVVNHYLTDQDAFFIKTDCPDGLKAYMRRAPEVRTDNDFDTENAKFKASFRASWGATDPRGIFGSPGA